MKIAKGVEWSAHACAILALLPPGMALSKEALADFLGVPPPYLAKQLQALSRAGIVFTQRGATGGYRLAKSPEELTLWDVTAAIEGTSPSFKCTEVRRNGPCGASPAECPGPCHIAAAFYRAEENYRQTLRDVSLTQLVAGGAKEATEARKQSVSAWLARNATRLS